MFTIEIDESRICEICGKGGATQFGVCLPCGGERAESGSISEAVHNLIIKGDQMGNVKRRKFNRRLKHTFTDSERLVLGAELAREIGDMKTAEDELKDIKASFKATIEGNQARINVFQNQIYSGYEWRPIDCEEVFDYEGKGVYIIRLDTREEVERRAMTADELQVSIIDEE